MEVSNLQELKDAATELMRFTCSSCERRFCEEDAEEEDGRSVPSPCSVIIRMRNALSANPIRNCDVGTAEEQAKRFNDFCSTHTCNKCVVYDKMAHSFNDSIPERAFSCRLVFLQLPYEGEEGGASHA